MSVNVAIIITLTLIVLDILVIALTYAFKRLFVYRLERKQKLEHKLSQQVLSEHIDVNKLEPEELLNIYISLASELRLSETRRTYITDILLDSHLSSMYRKRLRSRFYLKRCEAAFHLMFLPSKENQEALLTQLKLERNKVASLYLITALARQGVKKAIGPAVKKLSGMHVWYAQRIHAVLFTYGRNLLKFLIPRMNNNRLYMQRLVCQFAYEYPSEKLLPALIDKAKGSNRNIRKLALKALLAHYPQQLIDEFSSAEDLITLSYVIRAYGKIPKVEHIQSILRYSRKTRLHPFMVHALGQIGFANHRILDEILSLFMRARRKIDRELLAQVLSNRADYYLARIDTSMHEQVTALIRELAATKHVSAVLDFLNRNHDRNIEVLITDTLKKISVRSPNLRRQMHQYLRPEILERCDCGKAEQKPPAAKPHNEPPQRLKLAVILTLVITLTPVALFFTEFQHVIGMSWARIGRLYVVRFNYLLMFYSLAINGIYLTIGLISLRAGRIQSRFSKIKDKQFLFTKGVLPSISIIAPAYNEQANIIESTNSLLNQHYPDYELIVVNDGSKDQTLETLINYFELEKQDKLVTQRLKTRKLRGVYINRDFPNLIVVDKENGGKADSLNLGLNIANKEFFCGIDADSLLEPDSLLKAIAVMIDSPTESIAAGGNIFPINGCEVDNGNLETVTLPQKFLPRLQSLEYIRAFMTGRLGWAHLNSLLIISGAFGIFDRKLTIRTGGYLTKSGKFHKDTVGEDMELVVRLSRHMKEKKLPYSVDYAFDANCWTEVPETMKVLHRQRDRWHRGLIDIMLFHRRLIGNPRYGRLGMIGMLYYFLFEFIGPFIEIQGLFMVGISALIGVLNPTIALLLFSTTIAFGVLVSASSVMIAEFNHQVYSPKDVRRLLWMAVIENFGVRQLISFWRIQGFFSAMKQSKGWGAQTRTGFKKQSTS